MKALAATVMTTASGRNVDLLDPRPEDIAFADVAEHLAKEPRFNGATPGVAYSVAQHCCLGADAILAAGGGVVLAGLFLIHDGPEYLLKDDPTPKKVALQKMAETHGADARAVKAAHDVLTCLLDQAIHHAAGYEWPLTSGIAEQVKIYDEIMFATEWRDLMDRPAPYRFDRMPLAGKISPWIYEVARAEFYARCLDLLPALQKSDPHQTLNTKKPSERAGAPA